MLKVKEIFNSIQGEGFYMGKPTTFIRLSGCGVSCNIRKFCDTDFINGEELEEEYILSKVKNKIVCITGGEPLEQDIKSLCYLLRTNGYKVHIQTSGTIDMSNDLFALTNHVVCSPKLPIEKLELSRVDEMKVVNVGQNIEQYYNYGGALHHYLQPLDRGGKYNISETLDKLNSLPSNQNWALSIQTHKFIGVK